MGHRPKLGSYGKNQIFGPKTEILGPKKGFRSGVTAVSVKKSVVKSARHLRQRAKACKHVGGATFEGSLKRILKDLDAVEE